MNTQPQTLTEQMTIALRQMIDAQPVTVTRRTTGALESRGLARFDEASATWVATEQGRCALAQLTPTELELVQRLAKNQPTRKADQELLPGLQERGLVSYDGVTPYITNFGRVILGLPEQIKPRKSGGTKRTPKETSWCQCGCGEQTGGGNYRPGHDARHVGMIGREIALQTDSTDLTELTRLVRERIESPKLAAKAAGVAQRAVTDRLQRAQKIGEPIANPDELIRQFA